jgi:hypothetical protein
MSHLSSGQICLSTLLLAGFRVPIGHNTIVEGPSVHCRATPLKINNQSNFPTYKFDAIYREILSRNPNLLFIIRSTTVARLLKTLRLLGPQYNPRVFKPFLQIRELFRLPLPNGDSPVDFLNEPRRAHDLYVDPQDISEVILFQIQNTTQHLMEGDLVSSLQAPFSSSSHAV